MTFRILLAGLLCFGSRQFLAGQAGAPIPSSLPPVVVLHATVMDKHKDLVTTLGRENFKVFEDNVEQTLQDFKREDVPVSAGIVVDSSGSMRDKRSRVASAALAFVKASNSQSEFFVLNFNEEKYLASDFTGNPEGLRRALDKSDPRGGTALYDALIASLDRLNRASRTKRVLLVVSDGVDNASHSTLSRRSERRAHPERQSTLWAALR